MSECRIYQTLQTMSAEISMLRQYGPSVPEDTLRKLVKAFSELRAQGSFKFGGTAHLFYRVIHLVVDNISVTGYTCMLLYQQMVVHNQIDRPVQRGAAG